MVNVLPGVLVHLGICATLALLNARSYFGSGLGCSGLQMYLRFIAFCWIDEFMGHHEIDSMPDCELSTKAGFLSNMRMFVFGCGKRRIHRRIGALIRAHHGKITSAMIAPILGGRDELPIMIELICELDGSVRVLGTALAYEFQRIPEPDSCHWVHDSVTVAPCLWIALWLLLISARIYHVSNNLIIRFWLLAHSMVYLVLPLMRYIAYLYLEKRDALCSVSKNESLDIIEQQPHQKPPPDYRDIFV